MAIQKKKKRFFNIEIPLIKKSVQLRAFEPKELDRRNIRYDMTRILKGKGMILTLKVEVKENMVKVIPKETKILPYYLKRLVRKGTSYAEDSFSTDCKDATIRIKPFLVTRRKVPKRVRKALREKARKELIEYVKDKSSEQLFEELLKNQIQKPLSLKLKKIYPLSACEIRVLKVEKFKDE